MMMLRRRKTERVLACAMIYCMEMPTTAEGGEEEEEEEGRVVGRRLLACRLR